MPKPDIFLSYPHVHEKQVARLHQILKIAGRLVFFDRTSIECGTEWENAILTALTEATCIVVVWCVHSSESAWIKKETDLASSLQKPMIPVLLDQTPLPGHISKFQWIDLTEFFAHDQDFGIYPDSEGISLQPDATITQHSYVVQVSWAASNEVIVAATPQPEPIEVPQPYEDRVDPEPIATPQLTEERVDNVPSEPKPLDIPQPKPLETPQPEPVTTPPSSKPSWAVRMLMPFARLLTIFGKKPRPNLKQKPTYFPNADTLEDRTTPSALQLPMSMPVPITIPSQLPMTNPLPEPVPDPNTDMLADLLAQKVMERIEYLDQVFSSDK